MIFSSVYGKFTDIRNAFYEREIFKSFALGAKTVSVGNLTVGGTGKTPLVALIAEILAENGEKVAILTRGYGRKNPKARVLVSDGEKILADAATAGDEPFELARKLGERAVIVADANRVSAANWAREKFGITAFVLDDAFQHRRARRDLDIVCVDATNPFGNYRTLPSGILREPLKQLKRADLIVLTRANLVKKVENLPEKIGEFNSSSPIFISGNKISGITELNDFLAERDAVKMDKNLVKSRPSLAFCALGNPDNFFDQLRGENYDLKSTLTFPDHHFYREIDAKKIEEAAVSARAEILLTTAKDAVKLRNLNFSTDCAVVEIEMSFADEANFRRIVENFQADEKKPLKQ